MGERLVPHGADDLPWERIAELDGVYLTGGDAGAVRRARVAKVLVATARALGAIVESGVELDVLLGSATDDGERIDAARLDPRPRHIVRTRGKDGGDWEAFAAALEDDFNTPEALALMHGWRDHELLRRALGVFGLETLADEDQAPPEIVELAELRQQARAGREFEEADRLRAEIEAAGWELRDVPGGHSLVRKR